MWWIDSVIGIAFAIESLVRLVIYLLHKSLNTLTFQQSPNDKVAAYKCFHHRHKPHRNQSFSLILFGDRIQPAFRSHSRSTFNVIVISKRFQQGPEEEEEEAALREKEIKERYYYSNEVLFLLWTQDRRAFPSPASQYVTSEYKRHEIWMNFFIHTMISDEIDKVSGVIHIGEYFPLFSALRSIWSVLIFL